MSEAIRQEQRLRKLSKFLSLLLRHRPQRFPVKMDAQGFAHLDEVLDMAQALPNFRWVTRRDIDAVLNLPGRQRFEVVEQGSDLFIRALYGHTAMRPDYQPVTPPTQLYHGTTRESLETIRREGIRAMDRQYVHLAPDVETARSIALRHTAHPIILKIDAQTAHAQGQVFYQPTGEIFLTEQVPPRFVEEM